METARRILIFFPGSFKNGGIEAFLLGYQALLYDKGYRFDFIVAEENSKKYDTIEKYGGKVFRVLHKRESFLQYIKLFSFFLKNGYSIVYFHSDNFAVKAMIAARFAGFKHIIAQSHNNRSVGKETKMKLFKCFLVSRICKYRFAVSQSAGNWLFGKMPFYLVEAPIDDAKYAFSSEKRNSIREKYLINKDDIVIGCVGHLLSSHKNQPFLIKVFEKFSNENPNSWLILVGGGEDEMHLRDMVKEKGLRNVIFVGDCDDPSSFYSAFDVFCLPSFHEGVPISTIEAIINGLIAVKSSNVPDARGLESREVTLSLDSDISCWSKSLKNACDNRLRSVPGSFYSSGYEKNNAARNLVKYFNAIFSKERNL